MVAAARAGRRRRADGRRDRALPGRGGHIPYEGIKAGTAKPIDLPGILLAALATLGLGLVLGPEAPLIALGGGLAILAVRRVKKDTPDQVMAVLAAIATIFGSPSRTSAGPSRSRSPPPWPLSRLSRARAGRPMSSPGGRGCCCRQAPWSSAVWRSGSLAWSISLGSFRGGPTFPALFIGAVGGLLAAHLPGFSETPAAAVLMAAAVVSILRLPLSATVITLLLVSKAGIATSPLIIVAVVVAYLTIQTLSQPPAPPRPLRRPLTRSPPRRPRLPPHPLTQATVRHDHRAPPPINQAEEAGP